MTFVFNFFFFEISIGIFQLHFNFECTCWTIPCYRMKHQKCGPNPLTFVNNQNTYTDPRVFGRVRKPETYPLGVECGPPVYRILKELLSIRLRIKCPKTSLTQFTREDRQRNKKTVLRLPGPRSVPILFKDSRVTREM